MKKRISILCTDPTHPVNQPLQNWIERHALHAGLEIEICRDWRDLSGGDFLFLVSCHQIIRTAVRDLFRYTLVLHASDLPAGRGMSPHIWQILGGARRLTLSLLNAEDELDSGDIWTQLSFDVEPHELYDEINRKLFDAELQLMDWALANCGVVTPSKQSGEPSFFRKRVPTDSQVDPQRPLVDSFDLLRVADPHRYPAWFEHLGRRFTIRIEKA
jgi:methionyl-tRNA formyltransferase